MNFEASVTGISVVIVSHNSESYLPYCLASLDSALSAMNYEIIVVDNASLLNPQKYFEDRFPRVKWVLSAQNLGFGSACNLGVKESQYSHLLFVNPDVIVPKQSIESLLAQMTAKCDVGLCGCKILNADGSIQKAGRRSFPTPISALAHLLGLDQLLPNHREFGRYNLTYLKDETEITVDALSGSFFCVKKSVFQEVNGFDEDFFLYGEDLDLGIRIQNTGYKNYYFPSAQVFHIKGHSSKKKPYFSIYHFYLAMAVFVEKHKNQFYLPTILLKIGITLMGMIKIFNQVLYHLGLFWVFNILQSVFRFKSLETKSSKRILWFMGSSFQAQEWVNKSSNLMLLIRNSKEWEQWQNSHLGNIFDFDEIWYSGNTHSLEYFEKNSLKVLGKCKEFLVITDQYGLLTKLELNLLRNSLNLSRIL